VNRPIRGFFLLSVIMCALALAGTLYCASHGVTCWPGIVMGIYWLILAWGHSHEDGDAA
jgi:hypothetical protein